MTSGESLWRGGGPFDGPFGGPFVGEFDGFPCGPLLPFTRTLLDLGLSPSSVR